MQVISARLSQHCHLASKIHELSLSFIIRNDPQLYKSVVVFLTPPVPITIIMPLMKGYNVPEAPKMSSPSTLPQEHSPPPAYTSEAPGLNNAAPPDITAAFSNLNLIDSVFPTPDQCTAHLKVLESFHQLREDIAVRDGLFGISDAFVPGDETKEQQAEILMKIREKRWAVFVAKAAQRFEAWWTACVQPQAVRMKQFSLVDRNITQGARLRFDADDVPPLGKKAKHLS